MISMRNHLIHAYFDVDLDIVWTTVSEDLPSALPVLESVLAQIDHWGLVAGRSVDDNG
jgi:uncharacterized protein with HEPN domain